MNLYERLGVKTYVNAKGTMTNLGGSVMDPSVLEEMKQAGSFFVDMNELHEKAGKYLAALLGVEGVCITNGASGGIAICSAACIAGKDKGRILQLPDTTGLKNEVLMLKAHRNLYDQAIGLSGAKIKDVGLTSFCCLESLRNAVTEKTAMFFYVAESEGVRGSIQFSDIVSVMHESGIPVVVDAAAEVPPKSNVLKHYNMGADLVVFSGGKEIRGPQSSGFIIGRKDLIDACDANCCPHHSVGRSMKIDKENIAGIVRAVELFWGKDYDRQMQEWNDAVDKMVDRLSGKEDIICCKGYPTEPGVQPACIPRLYFKKVDTSNEEIVLKLSEMNPAIMVGIENGMLAVNPQCLETEQIDYVIESIGNV